MLKLDEDVFFHRRRQTCGSVGEMRVVLLDNPMRRFRVAQPRSNGRELRKLWLIEQTPHRPTMRMATDDDVLHSEHTHGVFDRCGFAAFDCSIGRDEVSGVSQNEKLPRFGLSEQVGIDARI